jgi:hypothetical protein
MMEVVMANDLTNHDTQDRADPGESPMGFNERTVTLVAIYVLLSSCIGLWTATLVLITI